MKKQFWISITRLLTVISAICVYGTFGGIEQGMLSWGRGLAQAIVFIGLTAVIGTIGTALERR